MQEREHTSKQHEQQLRLLKEKLLLIGYKSETSIAEATRALVERRPSLAQRVNRRFAFENSFCRPDNTRFTER